MLKRQIFIKVNRFQRPIINLVFMSSALTLVLIGCIAFLFFDTAETALYTLKQTSPLKILVLLILLVLPVAFYFIIVSAYRTSNRLVGPFERVLSELDSILEKGEKRHIVARKDDELAEEVLKRVNALIDRIP